MKPPATCPVTRRPLLKNWDPPRSSLGAVRSKDGTTIGYYKLGRGPELILLHRAGQLEEPAHRGYGSLRLLQSLRARPVRPANERAVWRVPGLRTEIEHLSALLHLALSTCSASGQERLRDPSAVRFKSVRNLTASLEGARARFCQVPNE